MPTWGYEDLLIGVNFSVKYWLISVSAFVDSPFCIALYI